MTSLLAECAPEWAICLDAEKGFRSWLVAPPKPGGSPNTALHLLIETEGGYLLVSEMRKGSRLPMHCPELHIMSDGTFCLARRAYAADSAQEVRAFWQDLGEFCLNVDFAVRRGRWPIGRWISHGAEAADLQARAETLAAELDVGEAYLDCVENQTGWLAAIVGSDGGRIPIDFTCPVCVDRRCGHLPRIKKLVRTERARRAAERAYFDALKRRGKTCCGMMPNCQLNRKEAA